MTGYTFPLTCVGCGSTLAHTASGAVYLQHTAAIAACTNCGSTFKVTVRLEVLNGPAIRVTLPHEAETARNVATGGRNMYAEGAGLIDALLAAQS